MPGPNLPPTTSPAFRQGAAATRLRQDRLLVGGAVRGALLATATPAARLPTRQDSPGYTAVGLVAAGRGRARRLRRPVRPS